MDITTIGRYQILERLGQGGMGVVYRAFDSLIERTVAIKVISSQLVDQPEQRERFYREARAAGRLAHRNIITIFDFGEDNGQPYIAMEYVEGQSLDARMRTGEPLTLPQKLAIIVDICDALAFAHSAGIVHRDMKPANVMITTAGSVRILDFGLARLVTSELTRSNVVIGTMNYMAPEQVRAEPIDHRADIFSVGVLLYELLSGRKAFQADSFAATMYKVLQDRPAPLGGAGDAIPAALVAVVDRAMEKDRDQRYQSMGDMLRDLEAVRASLPPASAILLSGAPTLRGPSTPSPRPPSGLSPESETTLDAPPVIVGSRTPLPSQAERSDASAAKQSAAGSREAALAAPAAHDPAPSASPSPSSGTAVPARASRSLPMVSAAALVIIAVAVIAFVMGRPAERADSGERAAPAAPASAAAPAPVAAGRAAAPGLAAPTPEAPVSVTDDVSQLTESARALYRAGKYDEAARAAGRVLQKAPGNAEAQRLMSDVARYARQAATEAVSSLAAARARAESAGAASAAPAAFGRALERERHARARLAARDYADATTTAYSAQGLFEAAAAEALGRTQARAVPEAAPTHAAPAVPVDEPHAAAPFPAVLPVPGPTPAAAPPPPAAPSPPPAPAATERRVSDPVDAIRRTMQQYTAALEARSLSGLKQVWPGLGGAQERAIRAEFDNARQISVALESPRIQVSGDSATVVATRRYALATVDGHELRSDTRSTFQLRAVDGSWVIESVRFDAAR